MDKTDDKAPDLEELHQEDVNGAHQMIQQYVTAWGVQDTINLLCSLIFKLLQAQERVEQAAKEQESPIIRQ